MKLLQKKQKETVFLGIRVKYWGCRLIGSVLLFNNNKDTRKEFKCQTYLMFTASWCLMQCFFHFWKKWTNCFYYASMHTVRQYVLSVRKYKMKLRNVKLLISYSLFGASARIEAKQLAFKLAVSYYKKSIITFSSTISQDVWFVASPYLILDASHPLRTKTLFRFIQI